MVELPRLKVGQLNPLLQAQAMPPAAWHEAGSTLLAAAPALRRRVELPPSPRGAMPAEYLERTETLRAAKETEALRKATLLATTLSTPRLQEAREARREEQSKLLAMMAPPKGSPRGSTWTRAKVTLTAGLLSGAGTCHALMIGNMTPAAFAESTSAMPPATQVTWLLSFGTCIARLGATLVDLREQVSRLVGSKKKSGLQALAGRVVSQVEGVAGALHELRGGTRTALAEGERACEETVLALAAECSRRAVVRQRWARAAAAALLEVQRRSRQLGAPRT